MEVMCRKDDQISPPYYKLESLPDELSCQYINHIFNNGLYKLQHTCNKYSVYFYAFPTTIGASKISYTDLQLSGVMVAVDNVSKFLLPSTTYKFSEFDVPKGFYGDCDVNIIIEQVRAATKAEVEAKAEAKAKAMAATSVLLALSSGYCEDDSVQKWIQDTKSNNDVVQWIQSQQGNTLMTPPPDESLPSISALSTSQPSTSLQSTGSTQQSTSVEKALKKLKIKSVELMVNERFMMWLKENINTNDYIVEGDTRSRFSKFSVSKREYFYSRFSRSRQDFHFYKKEPTGPILSGVAITETASEGNGGNYYNLEGSAGDCKMKASPDDKSQLIANMTKVAVDIALSAVDRGHLIDKITVYGFLINYEDFSATQPHKMIFDFAEGNSPQLISYNETFNAKEAVECAYATLENSQKAVSLS